MTVKTPIKMLVVDDDEAFREAMELEFSDRGYRVIPAATHREALGLAAVHRPQYAVIDLRLGGERGLEVLQDLVERLPGIRCLVLTGYASVVTAVEAMKLGAHHYLTKPCDPDAIDIAQWQAPDRGILVLGNESDGLSECYESLCQQRFTIPIASGIDSLNVSTATGIMLYEWSRQRRYPPTQTGSLERID